MGSTPLTDDIFWDYDLEKIHLVTAQQNLINLTDNLFADGTYGVEPDCVQWTQRPTHPGTPERGEHGEFNFKCDCVWSIMTGDREKATYLIPELSLYETVSLIETVLRHYLYEFLSRKDQDWEKHLDVMTQRTPFKRAAVQVLDMPDRFSAEGMIVLVAQTPLPKVNTRTKFKWYKRIPQKVAGWDS